jgi:hypothetical protein
MAKIMNTCNIEIDILNETQHLQCAQSTYTMSKNGAYKSKSPQKDGCKVIVGSEQEYDESTEESDNGQDSPVDKQAPTGLNINSTAFYAKPKTRTYSHSDSSAMNSQGQVNSTNLETQQFGNVFNTHPNSDVTLTGRFKNENKPRRGANRKDLQDATIKKPRRKFGCKQEKDKFVESYKLKKKTEICKNWELTGNCKFGATCAFAHGLTELQAKNHLPGNYKTKMCKQFHEEGYCPYGHRCQFLHLSIQKDVKKFTYCDILKENVHQYQSKNRTGSSIDLDSQLTSYVEHKRLSIFECICPDSNQE